MKMTGLITSYPYECLDAYHNGKQKKLCCFSGFMAKQDPENGQNGYLRNPYVKP